MHDARPRSHLFTVRLWPAPRADGEIAWRAKVTHVLSGETRYFQDWARLIGFLEDAGEIAPADRPPPAAREAGSSDDVA